MRLALLCLPLAGCLNIDIEWPTLNPTPCVSWSDWEGTCETADGPLAIGLSICEDDDDVEAWVQPYPGRRTPLYTTHEREILTARPGTPIDPFTRYVVEAERTLPTVVFEAFESDDGPLPATCDGAPGEVWRAPFEPASRCRGLIDGITPSPDAAAVSPIDPVRIAWLEGFYSSSAFGPYDITLSDSSGEVEVIVENQVADTLVSEAGLLVGTPVVPLEPETTYTVNAHLCDSVRSYDFTTGAPDYSGLPDDLVGLTWYVDPYDAWSLLMDGTYAPGLNDPFWVQVTDATETTVELLFAAVDGDGQDLCVPTLGPFTLSRDGGRLSGSAEGWALPEPLSGPVDETRLTARISADGALDSLEIIADDVRPPFLLDPEDHPCDDGTFGCRNYHWGSIPSVQATSLDLVQITQACP